MTLIYNRSIERSILELILSLLDHQIVRWNRFSNRFL